MALTLADLLALLPDNTTGAIGADDMRTVTTELWNQGVATAPVTSVDGETGAVNLTDNYTKLLTTTAVQAGNYTAVPGDFVLFDVSAASRTLTLPAAPPTGTLVGARIVTFTSPNAVGVNCSGTDVFNKPGGTTGNATALIYVNQSIVYLYNAGVWTVVAGNFGTQQADQRYLQIASTPSLIGGQDLELGTVVSNTQEVRTTTIAHSFLQPLFVRATADQTQNNVNTVANDTALVLNVLAPATYVVDALIYFDAGATADFRSGWSMTATGTFEWTILMGENTGTANGVTWAGYSTIGSTQQAGGRGVGTVSKVHLQGCLITTGAGNLQYKWSQGALVVEDTIRKAGSWLRAQRVA